MIEKCFFPFGNSPSFWITFFVDLNGNAKHEQSIQYVLAEQWIPSGVPKCIFHVQFKSRRVLQSVNVLGGGSGCRGGNSAHISVNTMMR